MDIFKREQEEIRDIRIFEQELVLKNFEVHASLSNILKKVAVSEASVERAFSKHKQFHSTLRANLEC